LLNIKINRPKLVNTWDITGNILAKFHGNILNLTENIAVFFGGGEYFFGSHNPHIHSLTHEQTPVKTIQPIYHTAVTEHALQVASKLLVLKCTLVRLFYTTVACTAMQSCLTMCHIRVLYPSLTR